MFLIKLSFKNISRNAYNYILYFFSIVFIVMVYLTFASLQNTNIIPSNDEFYKVIQPAFFTANSALFFFSVLFLWYSNSFFIKKRTKEFALYSVLGVKRNHIGLIVFIENLCIGVLALIFGIFLGSLFLKLFLMILLKLIGFSTSLARVYISNISISNTIKNYFIIFFIISIRNYISIRKIKLINLFRYDVYENKRPRISLLLSIIFALLISYGYYVVIKFKDNEDLRIFLALLFIFIGTYGLFTHLLVSIINVSKKLKFHYYKNINLFGTSQIGYKIKKNAITLATISMLIAGTILAVGGAYSYYYSSTKETKNTYPFTFAFVSWDKDLDKAVESTIKKYNENSIESEVEVYFARLDAIAPVLNDLAHSPSLDKISVISQSDFNKLCKEARINAEVNLHSDEEVAITDGYYKRYKNDTYINKNLYIKKLDKNFTISEFRPYFLMNESLIYRIVIVSDNLFKTLAKDEDLFRFRGYNIKNETHSREVTNEVVSNFRKVVEDKKLNENSKGYLFNNISSYYTTYKDHLQTSGLIIFIGVFLGFILLICTGSIIFFKQMSDAIEDKESYDILAKLGTPKNIIVKSIYKQVIFFFLSPLVVGICHALLAINLINLYLVNTNLIKPMILSILCYSLIYLFYCIITVNSYYKIVTSK